MRTTMRNVVVLAVAAVVLTVTALPAQGGGGGGNLKCRVKNMTTREASEDLQAQIDAAWTGDTLKIKGVCVGNFTIPNGANLTLLGVEKAGMQATLDGDGSGPVLHIAGDTDLTLVTLTDLTITGGYSTSDGGGIYNDYGYLTLNGSSQVIWNAAIDYGGGIFNEGGSVGLRDFARVSENSARTGGGICNSGGGRISLRDFAQVSENMADEENGDGGGIFNFYGRVTLIHSAEVSGNTAQAGGGIGNFEGSIVLDLSSQVRGNTAYDGGGIRNSNGSVSMWEDSKVSENAAFFGGGISNGVGTLNLYGSAQVSGNSAYRNGGGIDLHPSGSASMEGESTVTENIADADNDGYGEGGGIWGCVEGAVDGGNVYDNHLVSMSGPEDNIAYGCP